MSNLSGTGKADTHYEAASGSVTIWLGENEKQIQVVACSQAADDTEVASGTSYFVNKPLRYVAYYSAS